MRKPTLCSVLLFTALSLVFSACHRQTREDLMSEAAKYMREGNAKGAAVIFKSLVGKNPADEEARFELVRAYLETGKPDQAEKEAERLMSGGHAPARTRLLLGKAKLAQGNAAAAAADIEAFLTEFPNSAEGWEGLGHAHMAGNDLGAAENDYKRALAIHPERLKAALGLVEAELGLADLGEASARLNEILTKHPGDQAAMRLLAQIQLRQGDKNAAAATYADIAAKYPGDYRAKYESGHLVLETKGVTPEVERDARDLMKDFPREIEGFKLQGLIDFQKGAFAKAVPRFQEALRIRPDLETTYFLAVTFARAKDVESAVSALQTVLDNAPGFTEASRLMASLHMEAKRPDEAVAVLEKALKTAPNDPLVLSMLGDIYLGKKDLDKSLALFGAVRDDSPQAGAAHLKKGAILSAKGDPAGAEAEFRKAVAISEKKFEPKVYLATLLAHEGKLPEALAALETPDAAPKDQARALSAQGALLLGVKGHEDEALERFAKAQTLDPALKSGYRTLARFFAGTKQPDKALEEYRKLLSIAPQDAEANTVAAALYDSQGKHEEAKEHYIAAAASKRLAAFINLAGFYARQNMTATALNTLDQALALNKDSLPVLILKTRMLAALNDGPKTMAALQDLEQKDRLTGLSERLKIEAAQKKWPEAEKTASSIIALNHDSPSMTAAYALRALAREQNGDPAGAVGDYESVLSHDPSSPMALNNLAMIYAESPGTAAKAVELAQKALEQARDNPLVMDTLGYAMLKNGQGPQAQDILRRAAALAPKSEIIAAHLKMAEASTR